jgi:hypothetical protein
VEELGALILSSPEWPAGPDDPEGLLEVRRRDVFPGPALDESHGQP